MNVAKRLDIRALGEAHDEEALALESRCVQGGALQLRFIRPSFFARSRCYRQYRLLGGWLDGKLIAVTAHAIKTVSFCQPEQKVAYHYDLRVDPAFRRQGVGRFMTRAALDDVSGEVSMGYVMVAGQNAPMLGLTDRYDKTAALDFCYTCLPVVKRDAVNETAALSQEAVRDRCLRHHPATFVPQIDAANMKGHIVSLELEDGSAAASIWSNEHLIAEQIVRQPLGWRILAGLTRPLSRLPRVPKLPKPGEIVQSWFVYDASASSEAAFHHLIRAIMSRAHDAGKDLVYMLFQEGDARLEYAKRISPLAFHLPYRMVVRGDGRLPRPSDRIYVDIRDL